MTRATRRQRADWPRHSTDSQVPESLHPTQVEEMQAELIVGGLREVDGTVQGQELQSAKDHQDHPAKHQLQSAKDHQDHPAKHHREP